MRIALAQVHAGADIASVVAGAASEGAALVVFPEMFSNGYAGWDDDRTAWLGAAETAQDGSTARAFAAAAGASGLFVLGTFLERDGDARCNAACLWGPDGPVLHQRKRHICFFDAPEEALTAGQGSSVATIPTPDGPVTVGVMICMDREYPGPAADLTRQGAELVLVPNACPLANDPEVGDVRIAGVRGLAFGHAMAIAVCNYPEGGAGDGRSFWVDPRGTLGGMAGPGEMVLLADIDVAALKARREDEWFRWRSPE